MKLLYYWSGLGHLPPNVKEWLDANTKVTACNGDSHQRRHLRGGTKYHSLEYAHTTPGYPTGGDNDTIGYVRAAQKALGTVERRTSAAGLVPRGSQDRGNGLGAGRNDDHTGRNLTDCFNNVDEAKSNPQGTKRDSATMAALWRTTIPNKDAQAIWDGCEPSGVMDALGYDL